MIKWYEHDKVKVGHYTCPYEYDFISIGEYPSNGCTKEWADQFDVIINVSCVKDVLFEPSKPDQMIYWIPTNECGEWPFSNIASFFTIMDYCYKNKKRVYVHCAAGAYRSPSMVFLWLRYTGLRDLTAYQIAYSREVDSDDMNNIKTMRYKLLKLHKHNLPRNYEVFASRMSYLSDDNYRFITSLLNPKSVSSDRQVFVRRDTWFERTKRDISYKVSQVKEFLMVEILGDYYKAKTSKTCTKNFIKYDKLLKNDRSFKRYLDSEIRSYRYYKELKDKENV